MKNKLDSWKILTIILTILVLLLLIKEFMPTKKDVTNFNWEIYTRQNIAIYEKLCIKTGGNVVDINEISPFPYKITCTYNDGSTFSVTYNEDGSIQTSSSF